MEGDRTPVGVRLRRAALFLLFGTVLLIPKLAGLRRQRRWWNRLRWIGAGIGLALIGIGMVGRGGRVAWVLGLLLLGLALLLPPQEEAPSVDDRARELGALVVVNGGRVRKPDGTWVEAELYVAPDRVHVLDRKGRSLREIALACIQAVKVKTGQEAEEAEETLRQAQGLRFASTEEAREAREGWRLVVEWTEEVPRRVEFLYRGFFAEHLARVAETTLRGQLKAASDPSAGSGQASDQGAATRSAGSGAP